MTTSKKDIGDRIRVQRKEQRITQTELGRLLGVSTSQISAYENGESYPNPDSLAKIAVHLSVSLDYLIIGKEESYSSFSSKGDTTEEMFSIDLASKLMCTIIEAIEEHLQGNKIRLAPAKKAELITTLYEMFLEEEDQQVDKKTVAKLIRLAS